MKNWYEKHEWKLELVRKWTIPTVTVIMAFVIPAIISNYGIVTISYADEHYTKKGCQDTLNLKQMNINEQLAERYLRLEQALCIIDNNTSEKHKWGRDEIDVILKKHGWYFKQPFPGK